MGTKNHENKNFKYVRGFDSNEWVFLDSDSDKKYLTSHNGSCYISGYISYKDKSTQYFSIKTTRIMDDDEVDYIRDATPKEIERMIAIARINGYEFDEVTQKFKKIN